MCIDNIKIRLCSIYKHYTHHGSTFDRVYIYKYSQFVSIVKQSQQQGNDYKFVNNHRQKEYFVPRLFKNIKQLAFAVLCGKLTENEELEDIIPRDLPKIDARCTDLSIILLFLFISWNNLSFLFQTEGVILKIYREFYWIV